MRGKGRAAVMLAGLVAMTYICPGLAADGRTLQHVMAAEHDPAAQGYLEVDFEDDYQPFGMRSGKPISIVTEGTDTNHVLLVSGRDATWDGWTVEVTDWLVPSREYTFSAYIKQTERKDEKVNLSIELNKADGGVEYLGLKDGIVLPSSVWKHVTINFVAPSQEYEHARIYMQSGNEETFDFMTDEISIRPAVGGSRFDEAIAAYSLKDTYQNDFRIGMAFLVDEFRNENFRRLVQHHFNSGTYGNEFKPDALLDREATLASPDGSPEIRYEWIDELLTMARDNGTPIRGHVLVWHSQTPEWFFKVGYDENNYDVDSATMEWRMEQYIRKVLTYTQQKYPGVIYAWDVVNEAADDNGGYRKISPWYRIMGEGFIEKAFIYARKYADPSIKLYYNDYNEYLPAKRDTIYGWACDLRDKGLIDGIGMQSHMDLQGTSVEDYLETVEIYGSTGLEVQVTELDIHNTDKGIAGEMKLADKYAAVFGGLRELNRSGKARIPAVTIWGISDDVSWLTDNRGEKSYPLLFDEECKPKEAFRAVIDVVIPGVREPYQKKW